MQSLSGGLVLALFFSSLAACSGGAASPAAVGGDDVGATPDGHPPPPPPNDGGTDAMPPSDGGVPDDSGLGVSCSGASPGFAADVTPIFTQSCGGAELCHHGASSPWPYTDLVDAPVQRDGCMPGGVLVSPGRLDASYLVNKLTGVGMCDHTEQMPIGRSLPAAQIQTIADWICAGAKND
jgi:hypothetical protein